MRTQECIRRQTEPDGVLRAGKVQSLRRRRRPGGRFLLLGSFVGALLLQTLTTTMYNLGVPPAVAPVPKAILILVVCLLQSEHARRWATSLVKGGKK